MMKRSETSRSECSSQIVYVRAHMYTPGRKRVIPICPIIVAVMLILNQRRRSLRFASACVSCKFGPVYIRNADAGRHGRVRRRVQYTGRIRACELPERDSERNVARGRRDGNASATMIGLVEIHRARITHSTRASS